MVGNDRTHITDMDGFVEDGTGSPEGDRWLDSAIRLCMMVTRSRNARSVPGARLGPRIPDSIGVARREDREALASYILRSLVRRMYDGHDAMIDDVMASRIISMSAGTDRAVEGGALIDFPRTADRGLLSDLADIYDTVSDRIGGTETDTVGSDRLGILSRRHLLGPVLLCRDDWTDPGRIMSECATGYLPVSLICPDAEDHGYEGPIVDGSWLRMVAGMDDGTMRDYIGRAGPGYMDGMYDPVSFAGCSLLAADTTGSAGYSGTKGMYRYLMTMGRYLIMQGRTPKRPRLWMMPMTARTVETLWRRIIIVAYDPMRTMGGFRLDDVFHAVSGQLRPAETEWLLCDVDWDMRPSPMDVTAVLTGMDGSLDPGSWHRISWRPLAAAVRERDQYAAVTAMHAFRVAFSGVFPRTMIAMDGPDHALRLALAATIPDPASFTEIGGMLRGKVPERFVREDLEACGHTALLVLPHIEGSTTDAADDDDCAYFGIPMTPDPDGGGCPERLRLALEDGGVHVRNATCLGL